VRNRLTAFWTPAGASAGFLQFGATHEIDMSVRNASATFAGDLLVPHGVEPAHCPAPRSNGSEA
jgi:hypothetical protein